MYLNIDRIAVLAGLDKGDKSSLMREGVEQEPTRPATGAKPVQGAKPTSQTPPKKPGMNEMESDSKDESMKESDACEDDAMKEASSCKDEEMDESEVVYEVDETELMEALVDMREKRLFESKVRATVRDEISDILNEMDAGSKWLYGKNKPSNSKKGSVARGFVGPGFK